MNNALNFQDIIKRSLLNNNFFGSLSFPNILISLVITLILAGFILFIYRKTFNGVVFSQNFGAAIVMVSLITCLVIMTISSNLILSLGMVGALSIVRFRTAVKDPIDIVFMFWALTLGITTGAGLFLLSVSGSVFIGLTVLILMRFKSANNVFLLIIHYQEIAEKQVYNILAGMDYKLKSKTVSKGTVELTVEIKVIGARTDFVSDIAEVEGVENTSLVSYNGEFVA
ncbi:MAG: DUF4956 domain-containing protein [Bacillota bacterium]